MKICLISSMYPPRISGPSTQTRHLAILLKEHGVDPIVVTFGERDEIGYDDGIKVYYLNAYETPLIGPFLQYINAFFMLRKIFKDEKPDVIHHQTGVDYLSVISGFLAKRMEIPSLIKYAGDLVWERLGPKSSGIISYQEIFNSSLKGKLLTIVERFVLNNFTVIWSTSRFQKNSLTRILRISEEKIFCHPNYIMLNSYSLPKPPADKLTILSLCRFARWKRIDNTIKAFAMLNRDNVILRIVGGENPYLEDELKVLAVNLGIEDKVEFVGSISPTRTEKFFRTADIFVSSTTYEPFGITFVEAMNAGIPIVASKTGGIPEVVPDGKSGFLVEPDNIDDMTDRLRRLIDDPILRKQFGEYGREWVKQYDLREKIGLFSNIYQELEDSYNQRVYPIVEELDKRILHSYYKKQQEDMSRMYKDKYREYKQRRRIEIIKEIFAEYDDKSDYILDIGCGDGYASSYILNGHLSGSYFGMDISPYKLKKVLKKLKGSKVTIGDGESIPFKDKVFPEILCLETLEHLINPSLALKEFGRILRPGGISLISIPIDSKFQRSLISIVKRLHGKNDHKFNEHIQIFTMQSINSLLKESGFIVLTRRFCGFSFPLSNLILEYLSYNIFRYIDNLLCKIPLQCLGIGTKLGISFGREYLIVALQKK